MNCPECGAATRVDRTLAEKGRVRRVRLCEGPGCWERFTTVEQPDGGPVPALRLRSRWAREPRAPANPELPFAAQHAGYFSAEDAVAAGRSRAWLTRRSQDGTLVRVGRGVYRDAKAPATPHEALLAAWLRTGKAGVASHESALVLHGVLTRLETVHLTVPAAWARRRLRVPPSVELHPASLKADERAADFRLGLPVTVPTRTLLDLARAGRPNGKVREYVTRLVERRVVNRDELAAAFVAAGLDPSLVESKGRYSR